MIFALSALIAATGCVSTHKPAATPPAESGIVVIDRGGGWAYVIDTKAETCFLQTSTGRIAPARCGPLRDNLSEAAAHITWPTETDAAKRLAKIIDTLTMPIPIEGVSDIRLAGAKPADSPKADRRRVEKLFEDTIERKSDHHYVVHRVLVDDVLANPGPFIRGARIVPHMENGKATGFKLYAIRPTSIFGRLGFLNGDTINAINGTALTSPGKALEIYQALRTATRVELDITRRGKPVTLVIEIKSSR